VSDPGEVALKTASTSKEGSRRETSPMTMKVEGVMGHTITKLFSLANRMRDEVKISIQARILEAISGKVWCQHPR